MKLSCFFPSCFSSVYGVIITDIAIVEQKGIRLDRVWNVQQINHSVVRRLSTSGPSSFVKGIESAVSNALCLALQLMNSLDF